MHSFFRPGRNGNSAGSEVTHRPMAAEINRCRLGGSVGYKEPWEILSRRCGDSQLIGESLVNELNCSKPLRKPRDLQQMADELKMTSGSLDDLGMMSEIDNQKSVKEISQRCLPYIRNQWSKKALCAKRANGYYPSFKDFVAFFRGKAADCNDPVYGSDMLSHKCILKDLPVSLWWVEKRLERQMPWRYLAPRQCR